MTQDPTASWAQECEVHGLCECGVPLRRMVPCQLLSELITKESVFIEEKQLFYFRIKIFTLSIHCSLLHVSFMKSSTDISSREMFNKSK